MIETIKEFFTFIIAAVIFVIGFSLLLVGMAWWVRGLVQFFPKF